MGNLLRTAWQRILGCFLVGVLAVLPLAITVAVVIWVSGIVGQTANGFIPEGTVEQFDIALAAMDACLRAAGGAPHTVTKVQVFMTDISERPAINPARIAYFGEHRPASTLVEVSALVDPRLKVEIECMAMVAK